MVRLFTSAEDVPEQGSLARLPAGLIVRVWAALLFVTIALQAAAPIGPADHAIGSAFTAASHEFALSPRQEVRAAAPIAPLPLIPARVTLPPRAEQVVEDSVAAIRTADAPARSILALRPGPRAPPFA